MTKTDLKNWRLSLHKTQPEMADHLGIGLRVYNKYESEGNDDALPRSIESRWAETMEKNKSDFQD